MRNAVLPSFAFRGLAFVLLVLGACAPTRPAEVITDRTEARGLAAPRAEEVFHFVVYGDRTGGPAEGVEILAQAVEETNLLDPDLVMTVGDLVEGYNQRPEWLEQMRAYRAIMDRLEMDWYPVAGNHDIYWFGEDRPPGHHEGDYEANFGPLWYWFAHKNAAFVVLYTDEGDPETGRKSFGDAATTQMSPRQIAWLERTLAATAGFDHVFVFMHHPRWIERIYPETNWPKVHALLAAAGNVSAVFAGHIHRQRYEGLRDGILYYALATIGGGMPMDKPGTGWANHMDLMTVRGSSFEIASIPVGVVYDPKTMTPAYLDAVQKATRLPITLQSEGLALGADGAAQGSVAYRVDNNGTGPVKVTLAAQAENGGGWSYRPRSHSGRLEPGESLDVTVQLERRPDDLAGLLSVPEIVLDVDYLGGPKAVALPQRSRPVALEPEALDLADWPLEGDQVLLLDGSGASLWFPESRIRLPQGPFTLETWFRADDPERNQALLAKTDESGFALALVKGRPHVFAHFGGAGYTIARGGPENAVEKGTWHHMAGVFDGAELRLYLDGRLIASEATGGLRRGNGQPLYVGAEPGDRGRPVFPFKGALDEVRISTVARYRGEAFDPPRRHRADAQTYLLLHMDRPAAPFALDASPARRHGLGVGALAFEPAPTALP